MALYGQVYGKNNKLRLEPIVGYDPKNYDKKQGIDASGNDIISNKVIEQIADIILAGYADSSIRDLIYELYGVNSYQARYMIMKAHKFILDFEEKQEENMLQKQNSRLFGLYRLAMNKGDEKTALTILSEINKLNKLYTTKIEVSTDIFTLDLGIETNNDESKEQTD